MNINLKLLVDVKYDCILPDPLLIKNLSSRLQNMVYHAMANGMLTDDLDACINSYNIAVDLLAEKV